MDAELAGLCAAAAFRNTFEPDAGYLKACAYKEAAALGSAIRGSKNTCKHFERAAKPRKGTVKMYKAIIADDEETVRRGLVTHF